MPLYIESVSCLNINRGDPIIFCNPKSKNGRNRGKINVICGENGIGKSFLLKQSLDLLRNKKNIEKSLSAYQYKAAEMSNQYLRIKLLPEEASDLNILHAELFNLRNHAGQIPLRHAVFPKERKHIHEAFARTIHQTLLDLPRPSGRDVTISKDFDKFWEAFRINSGFRQGLLRRFEEGRFYETSSDFLKELRVEQKADLGVVRKGDALLLALRTIQYELAFDDWSDGLKSLACLDALLRSDKYSLVLLDEIENHLHPRMISTALEILKRHDAQCIVTTHHPHVIFSQHVDKVVYLERDPEQRPARTTFFDRRALTLETDFEKISSIYGMFHERDRKLLAQGALVRNEADATFYREVLGSFGYGVAATKRSSTADAQSEAIAAVLSQTTDKSSVSVLDIGAGKGRTYWELEKIPAAQKGAKELKWDFWEPEENNRTAIRSRVDVEGVFSSYVFDDQNEVPDAAYDVACVVNVLHELTQEAFAEVLLLANRAVNPDGRILISEIYPLLQSERYAVPYSNTELRQILRNCGFEPEFRDFRFRTGSGYVLSFTPIPIKDGDLAGKIATALSAMWDDIEDDRMRQFKASTGRHKDFYGYRQAWQNLLTVYSIQAHRKQLWK